MKKKTLINCMIVEFPLAMISMGLLFSDVGAMIYLIALGIFAVVLGPFYLWLKKEQDEDKKRKIRRIMALIMAIPIVIAIAAIVTVVVALMMYYG